MDSMNILPSTTLELIPDTLILTLYQTLAIYHYYIDIMNVPK